MLNQLVDDTNTKGYEERSCSNILPLFYIKLLEQTNKTEHAYPLKTIYEQISNTVDLYPNREAISYQGVSLTYTEFWKKLIRWRISYVLLEWYEILRLLYY